ncbi:MAG: hypothetical protein SFY68_02530 [Candidatus Sumerlaeia bacterium]|nr:hypothetical protein [Candidatus Sumerlaeia bacterium]
MKKLVTVTMFLLASTSYADDTKDSWQGGDFFIEPTAGTPPLQIPTDLVQRHVFNAQSRSLNVFGDRITNNEVNERGAFGRSKRENFWIGLECWQFDETDDETPAVGGQNNGIISDPNIGTVGGLIYGAYSGDAYKTTAIGGLSANAVNMTRDEASNSTANKRVSLLGFAATATNSTFSGVINDQGTPDESDDELSPFFSKALNDTMTAALFNVTMDARKTSTNTQTVTGTVKGIDVLIQNGIGNDGKYGVEGESVIGVDVSLKLGNYNDYSIYGLINDYIGVKVNYPDHVAYFNDPYDPETRFSTNTEGIASKSFGIFVQGEQTSYSATELDNKKSTLSGNYSYAGFRSEAPHEIADKRIEDPLSAITYSTGYLPSDRPVYKFTGSNSKIINNSLNNLYYPSGVEGQRILIINAGTGSLTVSETTNSDLSSSSIVLNQYDTISLIYIDNKWRQTSYSNN